MAILSHLKKASYVIALTVCLCHAQGYAQTATPAQGQVIPGQVLKWTQKSTEFEVDKDKELAPPEPTVVDETKEDASIDPSLTKKFLVNTIRIEGTTLLDSDDVADIVSGYEGKELSFVDLQGLSDQLTDLYQEEGYVTSRVYLPPQRIEGGQVTLKASEGAVGEVTYLQKRHFKSRAVLPRIGLDQGDHLSNDVLSRQLRRINLNPDLEVQAVLKAGAEYEETDIDLRVIEQHPYHVKLFYDNMGRRLIGQKRLGVTSTHNNLLGFGDQLSNTVSFTRRSFGTVTHYEMPVGSHGTRLNFDHAYSNLTLGEEFKALNVKGTASIYSGYLTQDLFNTENMRLDYEIGMDFKQVKTEISGQSDRNDNLRVLRQALNFDQYDRLGRTIMRHEIGIGLDILGGKNNDRPTLNRLGAGSQFFRYTGSLTRLQKMPWNTFGVFRAMGQVSQSQLSSIEQFQLGGTFTARGYKEGRIIGDQGFFLSGEWHVPAFFIPHSWTIPKTNYNLRDNIQFVTFTDFGGAYTNKPVAGVERSEYVLGAGVGVRARLTDYLVGRIDLGFPVMRQAPDSGSPRVHFGLESNLF